MCFSHSSDINISNTDVYQLKYPQREIKLKISATLYRSFIQWNNSSSHATACAVILRHYNLWGLSNKYFMLFTGWKDSAGAIVTLRASQIRATAPILQTRSVPALALLILGDYCPKLNNFPRHTSVEHGYIDNAGSTC